MAQKRSVDSAEVRRLKNDLANAHLSIEYWKEQLAQSNRQSREQEQAHKAELMVILSDRDRLTAALEVCTRRLASPAADRDATRAGWRYASEK